MSRWLTVVSVLLATSTPVVAQTVTATTGAINGTVTDSTKAVLPGVTVTLSGPSLMGTPVEATDQSGTFRFSAVPPGTYTLTHELTGFRGVTREGIVVTLGFTATVNSELSPGAVSENITVSGAAPVVDVKATEVTTHFDSEKLASLPGARDFWSVLAQTPAMPMAKMDVGGSGALNQQAYTAYGLGAVTGMNRNEVEGIRVGAANGANDNYYSDYGSFAEIAVKATGNTASMSVPGTLGQYVSKSGGNAYHGSLYADYQNETLESTNIDAAQIALGVTGGPGLDVHNVNRLQIFETRYVTRRVPEKGRALVVWGIPLYEGRAALRLAARRRLADPGASGNRQGDLQPHTASEGHRICAEPQPESTGLLQRWFESAVRDRRCVAGFQVSSDGLEGRVQLRRERRPVR